MRYKTKTDSTYSEVAISNGASGIVLPNVTFSAGSSYDIQFAVTDTFTTTPVTSNRSIGTGFRLVHYNKNHKAIAVGKQSEATGDNKLLEVALPLSFSSDAKKSVIDLIYPVNSIYMSVNNISPATLFGGTWEQIKDKFLLACGSTYTNGSTGGEATHTLTTDEIPAHTHGSKSLSGSFETRPSNMSDDNPILGTGSGIVSVSRAVWSGNHDGFQKVQVRNKKTNIVTINATHEHTSVGGNGAHNNMPPYLAVYVWKRTA